MCFSAFANRQSIDDAPVTPIATIDHCKSIVMLMLMFMSYIQQERKSPSIRYECMWL